jgi:hypothetical protein
LNGYSFTELADETYYRPYGVLAITPSSAPLGSTPNVIITGKGFIAEEGITPRCRFGTPASYAITEAEILSYTRLACRAPQSIPGTPTGSLPRDIPFAVALSGDEFVPWTASTHRFLVYTQPIVETSDLEEVAVGRIATVYVSSSEDTDFFDPVSVPSLAT